MKSKWIRLTTSLWLAIAAVACSSEPPLPDPCAQFEILRTAVNGVDDLDPETTTTQQARAISDEILVELRRFETAADGMFGRQINDFRGSVHDIQRLMVELPDESTIDTWGPLLAVSVDIAQFEFARLSLAVRPACRPAD